MWVFAGVFAKGKSFAANSYRDRRAAFTPLQLSPSKTRKIVQGPRRCGR
jgi:hypothetical protein